MCNAFAIAGEARDALAKLPATGSPWCLHLLEALHPVKYWSDSAKDACETVNRLSIII